MINQPFGVAHFLEKTNGAFCGGAPPPPPGGWVYQPWTIVVMSPVVTRRCPSSLSCGIYGGCSEATHIGGGSLRHLGIRKAGVDFSLDNFEVTCLIGEYREFGY